jgi:DegV family protein with EDD domain
MLIVFDGAVDIPDDLAASPLLRRVPGEVWDGETALGDPDSFWTQLRKGNYPSTTPPTVSALATAYEHPDLVIALHVSGRLSATIRRAEEAAERAGPGIIVIDTGSISVGAGLVVAAVHHFAQHMGGSDSLIDFARSLPARLHTFAIVQDIESLRRSDRSGLLPSSHLARNHPLLLAVRGRIVALSQPKHRSGAISDLATHVRRSAGPNPGAWAFGHGDAPDAESVVAHLTGTFRAPPRYVTRLDPTVGAHLGPDSIVVGVMSGPIDL